MGSGTQSITSISTGTGVENENPLTAQAAPDHKTRFASRQTQTNEKKAELKLASAEVKVSKRPVAATPEESADEKVQAAPLGLAGDTAKKKKTKHKREKGQAKERFQEQTKPVAAPTPVAPTVNPTLGTSATGAPAPPAAGANDVAAGGAHAGESGSSGSADSLGDIGEPAPDHQPSAATVSDEGFLRR